MKINIEKELQKQLEQVTILDNQLQQLQEQRKAILEELFRKQGIIQYLQQLNGSKETVVSEDRKSEQD